MILEMAMALCAQINKEAIYIFLFLKKEICSRLCLAAIPTAHGQQKSNSTIHTVHTQFIHSSHILV